MSAVIAYAYEAAEHCVPCTVRRFDGMQDAEETGDREGNPVHAIFSTDEVLNGIWCDDCGTCVALPVYGDSRHVA